VDERDDSFWEPRVKRQFEYFSRQLGIADWSGVRVLDFGGNDGNMLRDPACTIDRNRYWCLDVYREILEDGRNAHPEAHFVHYDRYHAEYNPAGVAGLPIPELGGDFDIIVAYSVFTHAPEPELRELVGQLRDRLTGDGRLAFTFLDPAFVPPPGWAREDEMPRLSNLRWRLAAARDGWPEPYPAPPDDVASAGWVTLAGDGDPVAGGYGDLDSGGDGGPDSRGGWIAATRPGSAYITLCTEEYMRRIYPEGNVLPPPPGYRHSCCVLGR
jgi:SAM-dependent methyltransferase